MSLRFCALPKLSSPDGARRRAGAERRRARALDARVHVRLVVVTDEQEAVAALECARQSLQADVVGPAVAGEHDDRDVRRRTVARSAARARSAPLRRRSRRPRRSRTRRASRARSMRSSGSASSRPRGSRSRSRRPSVGRSCSSTVRTTIGMPQPWQSACPPRSGCDTVLMLDECLQTGHSSPRTPR